MTVLVGITCRDGVVIGADSAHSTAVGNEQIVEQPGQKLWILDDRIIVAGTGSVGLGQRFYDAVDQLWKAKKLDGSPVAIGKKVACAAVQDFQSTHLNKINFGALVAFPAGNASHLCEFETGNMQPELKTREGLWYGSIGSGQRITDPFLGLMRRVFWNSGPPSLQDGIFAVTWALRHAIDVNPGGIGPPVQIATLERNPHKKGQWLARLLDKDELGEHEESVKAAEEFLGRYPGMLRGEDAESDAAPEPPSG